MELLVEAWTYAESRHPCPPADGNNVDWARAIRGFAPSPIVRGGFLANLLIDRGAAVDACDPYMVYPTPPGIEDCGDPRQGVTVLVQTNPQTANWAHDAQRIIDYFSPSSSAPTGRPDLYDGPYPYDRRDLREAAYRLNTEMHRWERAARGVIYSVPHGAVGRWLWNVGIAFVPFRNYYWYMGTWPIGGFFKPPAFAWAPNSGCSTAVADLGTRGGGGSIDGGGGLPDAGGDDGLPPALPSDPRNDPRQPMCTVNGACPEGYTVSLASADAAQCLRFALSVTFGSMVLRFGAGSGADFADMWNEFWFVAIQEEYMLVCQNEGRTRGCPFSWQAIADATAEEGEWSFGGNDYGPALFVGRRELTDAELIGLMGVCVPIGSE